MVLVVINFWGVWLSSMQTLDNQNSLIVQSIPPNSLGRVRRCTSIITSRMFNPGWYTHTYPRTHTCTHTHTRTHIHKSPVEIIIIIISVTILKQLRGKCVGCCIRWVCSCDNDKIQYIIMFVYFNSYIRSFTWKILNAFYDSIIIYCVASNYGRSHINVWSRLVARENTL